MVSTAISILYLKKIKASTGCIMRIFKKRVPVTLEEGCQDCKAVLF